MRGAGGGEIGWRCDSVIYLQFDALAVVDAIKSSEQFA
jgi:hypothetical protein